MKIAIATEADFLPPKDITDDNILAEELKRLGHKVDIIDWKNKSIRLHDYDAIYVSTTWNIPKDPDDFIQWIKDCESDGKSRLINSADVILDNVTKSRYLTHLKERFGETEKPEGSIAPSRFYSVRGSAKDSIQSLGSKSFDEIIEELDRQPEWRGKDIVIKPIISGDGDDTFVYHRSGKSSQINTEYQLDNQKAQQLFDKLVHSHANKGVILQPYLQSIENGEYSLIFFNDKFSHAIHKPAGFRAPWNGKYEVVEREQLPGNMLELASNIVRDMRGRYGKGAITRSRVDLFDGDKGPILSEFECTEPNVNLKRLAPATRDVATRRYASAIAERAAELSGPQISG